MNRREMRKSGHLLIDPVMRKLIEEEGDFTKLATPEFSRRFDGKNQ